MANVLIDENFLIGLADNIREKTGRTEKMKPSEMLSIAQEEWGSGGGGTSRVEIFPENTISGFEENNGKYYWNTTMSANWLAVGQEYIIVFDGVEYTCTAVTPEGVTGIIALGNLSIEGDSFADSGEPFIIIHQVSDSIFVVETTVAGESHTMAVYQESASCGSSALVKYVTFMNYDGSEELYKKPTISGDDCVDVVAKGYIETPTKESTAQYNYTYAGWSLTVGGSADNTALQNVTEDRVVYTIFSEELRYYTINFYDGDSLLKSETLPYGSTPNFEPDIKAGYEFVGWSPEITMVVEDADYYAQWVEGITFANATWEQIVEIAESGNASSYFNIGDTRTLDLNYEDGTTDTYTVAIAGFDHDYLTEGDGESTAGITIVSASLSDERRIRCGASYMGNSTIYPCDWENGTTVVNMHNEIMDGMETTLKNAIKQVNKPTKCQGTLKDIPSYIWALSCSELGVSGTDITTEGSMYPYFKGATLSIRLPDLEKAGSSEGNRILTRTEVSNGSKWRTLYVAPYTSGLGVGTTTSNLGDYNYIRFGFCI